MKYLLKIFALLTFLSLNLIDAQQVVKVDTISGTPLSMSMDKKIGDLLENLEDSYSTGAYISLCNKRLKKIQRRLI